MRSKSFKLIGIVCMALALVLLVNSAPVGFVAHADTVEQMKDKLGDLQDEAEELENRIAQLRKDKAKKQELYESLQKRVDNTQARIDVCNDSLAEIDGRITALNLRIAEAEGEMAATKLQYKKRLRAIYMSGGNSSSSNIIMLLDSDGFADLLARTELTNTISKKDQAMIDELTAKMAAIQADKDKVEEERAAQAEVKKELDTLKKSLSTQLYEAEEAVKDIKKDEDKAESKLDEIEDAIQEFEDRIAEALKDADKNENLDFGAVSFQWPCPGFQRISSPFGYRYHPITGKWKLHGGTDIAGSGISNTPARAAADGVVQIADYNSSYGYYVMVYHGKASNGNTYATLYAHLWSYCVKEGQYVTAGQKLGNIGSTGSSTAPHLHFEVRKNGERVNAMDYF